MFQLLNRKKYSDAEDDFRSNTEKKTEFYCTKHNIPSMKNVLLNHPRFNSESLFPTESIETVHVDVPVSTIKLDCLNPINAPIDAVADTGSSMQAISLKIASKYKNYLRRERRDFYVRTGNGIAVCNEYLPIYIRNRSAIIKSKFYVLPELPYDFLIGRSLIKTLGYHLMQDRVSTYTHYGEPLTLGNDTADTDYFDKLSYPITTGKKYDLSLVNVGDSALEKNIKAELLRYQCILSKHEADVGRIPGVEFEIPLRTDVDTTPIVRPQFPCNRKLLSEGERQIKFLLDTKRIRLSTSPWRASVFAVPKKNGEARLVFDYRGLNAISKLNKYPLPRIENLQRQFRGKTHITSLDMKSGYWHIGVAEKDREKLAFIFNGKLYEWCVMPFGPTNAPGYFQYVMHKIFKHLEFVLVYLDDISILSDSAEQHIKHLRIVFETLAKYNIKLRLDKCAFAQSETEFLGFLVDKYGIRVTKKYKEKVLKVPTPKSKKQLQRFIGLVNYLHKFIPNIHAKLKPLLSLIKKNVPFHWTSEHQSAFEEIKELIQQTSFLMHPNFDKEFVVVCDASSEGMGAMLAQYDEKNNLRPIEFASKVFTETQKNWHISEQETFAVVYFVEKWRHCLMNQHFKVLTDHKNLQELFNRSKNFRAGKLYRWAVRLQEFTFTAEYLPGSDNVFADYLSRDALDTPTANAVDRTEKEDTSDIVACYLQHFAKEIVNGDFAELYVGQAVKRNKRRRSSLADLPVIDNNEIRGKIRELKEKSKQNRSLLIPTPELTIPNPSAQQRIEHQIVVDKVKKLNSNALKRRRSDLRSNPVLLDPPLSDVIQDEYSVKDFTPEFVRLKQRNDTVCFAIIHYLEEDNATLIKDLPRCVSRVVITGRFLLDKHNVLRYKHKDRDLVVVPSMLRASVLNWAHHKMHHGSKKMQSRLFTQFWWPGATKDVEQHCQVCSSCQSVKRRRGPLRDAEQLKLFSAHEPFQLISIDIVGPLPQTTTGDRYIVSMIDKFSRYCMLVPVQDIKALTVVKALEKWITVFGAPYSILSDNGSQFTSELYALYAKQHGVKLRFTTAYHPECNGQIERLHRWIKERLALISYDSGANFLNGDDDWSDYLPIIQRSYNTTPTSMTNFAPSEIVFGQKLRTEMDHRMELPYTKRSPLEFVEYMENRRNIITQQANAAQARYDAIRAKSYNKNRKSASLSVGDFVLHDISARLTGNAKKLLPNFVGPYEITKISNDNKNYTLTDVQTGLQTFTAHLKHLKPFKKKKKAQVIAESPQELLVMRLLESMDINRVCSAENMSNNEKNAKNINGIDWAALRKENLCVMQNQDIESKLNEIFAMS